MSDQQSKDSTPAVESPEEAQTSSPSLEGKDLLSIYDHENEKNEDYYKDAVEKAKAEKGPSEIDSRDQSTPDSWIKRNSLMVRLTGNHPFNSEPPLDKLMDHGFITPVPLHYVRNHGQVPHQASDQASWSTWTVEVCGKVKKPKTFTMEELTKKFPSKVFPATLVCAGNRRKEQKMVKKTKGFNWGAAGISTSMWKGVPLHLVLDHCEVDSKEEKAFNVCFEGAEDLARGGGSRGAKYGTSIKIEFAMDPGRDIIIAYKQNGEKLAEDHGFPVRMIIPGFIGGRMVKWLKRIIVTEEESNSYYHFKDNRVFPSHVDLNLANSEAWWYKPEYIINELNINSVITTPRHEMTLLINSLTKKETLRGYAYSGGGKKVTRVEVTMDGGETWHVCNVDHPEKPNKYGKYWCWCFWSLEVEVLDLLRANEIAVRAWDETLNTQPQKLIWNLMGMMNNCWFRVKIRERMTDKGEKGLIFEHPTQPGNQSGGWMVREKHLKNTSSNVYSVSDLERHNLPHSAWIVVHGHVYDCTQFLKCHPGGEDSILVNAGTDCTEVFDEIHSDYANNLLENYRIGELITRARNKELVPQEKVPCKLVKKTSISHDVRRFRFALSLKDQVLRLLVGKHIFLYATINGEPCMRAYTPISSVDEVGFFDLLVKIYFKNEEFPNGGLMSNYLDTLPLESSIDVKGPVGHIEYKGKGKFMVYGEQKSAKKLAMIAGGTGITPIYQVMQAILKDPEDKTEMNVVYANHTEHDILMKEELDNWANEYQDRVKVCYVVGKKIKEGGKYSVGRIDQGIMRKHLPEASDEVLALVCGPPPMIESAVNPNLEKMGYDLNRSLLEF